MKSIKESINYHLKENKTVIEKLFESTNDIDKITRLIMDARDKRRTIFTIGNGGSGSTASHFVSDLLKTAITSNDKRFSAISLVDNVPVMLAWSNDVSFEEIFTEQLRNFLNSGDIIIGFSGSGKSKNILKAFQYGKEHGAVCIGITGMSGGEFPKVCDVCLIVPSMDMLTIESLHLMICHSIVTAIRSIGTPMFNYEQSK